MKLPKRELPEYELRLPVADVDVTYRPYTVKEQKILMMAAQGNDPKEITSAVKQVIENCSNVNWDILCDADFEFLFTRLMAASVSNIANAEVTHDCGDGKCPVTHPTGIDMNNIEVVNLDALKSKYTRRKNYWVVPFDDEAGACMRQVLSSDDTEQTLFNSIVNVYDADGVYDEFTKEELIEYIDGLHGADFEKIQDFINTQPYCTTLAKAKCQHCRKDISVQLKGVLDFFV
jgi:hypothetical protein